MFWPRITLAAALATLIVLVPAIWWNRSHPLGEVGNVAVRDRTAAAANGPNAVVPTEDTLAKAPAASAAESTVNLADNSQVKIERAATPASEAEAFASSTGVAQGRVAPAAAPAAGQDSKAESDRTAAAAPPVARPSSASSLGIKQQFSQQSAVQSFRNNAQGSRAENVLNTFQVQQQGSEIRVLDADGSTYTGKIEQLAKSAKLDSPSTARRDAAKQTRSYAAKATREDESAPPQSYFRATGFSVSLKKTLVFEGNYAVPRAQQSVNATANDRERADQDRDRARIVGTVRVNGEAPVAVDAIAETPEPAKKSQR